MTQLSHLLRLRDQGVRFDAYLMDAFWYAPDGGYREWRKPHWPDGPERWLMACQESGLLPGLWFTVNTLCHLEPTPKWRDSVDEKGWGMSLCEGGFLHDFAHVLDHWYSRGVRIFKFDFAEFRAVPAGTAEVPVNIRRDNVAAFREMLWKFRHGHPEAILMAFNGFEESECMDRTDRKLRQCIDPAWLESFDSLYCGDPRPADVPDVDFWRSVDLYSDHMVRVFERSEIPLDRIDNCGFMAGPTGTCYWRGKAGWKRMLLLSLARGGRIHVAYGDLSQFSDEDARWWAAAQALYAPSMLPAGTQLWGDAPGNGAPYGWLSLREESAVFTLVNPGPLPEQVPLWKMTEWRLATCEPGFAAEIRGQEIKLGPGQVAVLTEGPIELGFSLEGEARAVTCRVVEAAGVKPADGGWVLAFDAIDAESACLIVQQKDSLGYVVRNYPTEHDWAFRAEFRMGGEVVAVQDFPPRKVWSGMSWACFPLPEALLGREFSVFVESTATTPIELDAHVRLTTGPAVLGA